MDRSNDLMRAEKGNPKSSKDSLESSLILNPNPRSRVSYIDRKVAYLVSKYQSPEHKGLFRKAAEHISEKRLGEIVEASFSKKGIRSPRAYFIKCVKNEPGYE